MLRNSSKGKANSWWVSIQLSNGSVLMVLAGSRIECPGTGRACGATLRMIATITKMFFPDVEIKLVFERITQRWLFADLGGRSVFGK